MKILVTGATGFIGNHLIRELLKSKSNQIVATSRNIDKARKSDWFSKVEYIEYNFNDGTGKDLFEFFGKPDQLIHLAWESLSNYNSPSHMDVIFPNHCNFIESMIAGGLMDVVVTGTCFEYGMIEGCLSEDMDIKPENPYAVSKDSLRRFIADLQNRHSFTYKWIRLFYMYGEGQSKTSLMYLLDKAIQNKDKEFNMSGGEQLRDFLPIDKVIQNIELIARQNIYLNQPINCCSGKPVSVKKLVKNYLKKKNHNMKLNLGFYPYPDYESMEFWGDNCKLQKIKKEIEMNQVEQFEKDRDNLVKSNGKNEKLKEVAHIFLEASADVNYSYNFSWMGRPIIQYPQDMIAMQELIWKVKPDLIIETGIAHGGSLIFSASMLTLLESCGEIERGEVLGIDIDIREHNKKAIENHPMSKKITMFEGSSISKEMVAKVHKFARRGKRILVCLDSNHTHEHVLAELKAYASLTSVDSYCVVFDTLIEDMPQGFYDRHWDKGDNPKTAVWEYLKTHSEFEIDENIQNKLLITVAPDGYLKRKCL